MIVIVDCGIGNLKSVQNMFWRIGHRAEISCDVSVIAQASKLVLPGVGSFRYGMHKLKERCLIEVLNTRVLKEKTPILGICLGAQFLGKHSEEGDAAGLGWLPMRTRAFDRQRLAGHLRVPHMGWTETSLNSKSELFHALETPARFYYVHSYHFECETPEIELCRATYGYGFISGVRFENIFGVQFHPEKSRNTGMKILQNFAVRV